MKNPYMRVVTLTIIQTAILVIFFTSGMQKYIQSNNTYVFATASIIGSCLAIAATWLFFRGVDKKPLSTMGLGVNAKQGRFIGLSAAVTVGLFVLVTVLMSHNGLIEAPLNRHYFADPHIVPMFLISALSWFLVGFNEEIMYRGYMVVNLKHLSTGKMVAVSSILFAFSHVFVDGLNPIMLFVTLSAALTLMYVYLKTGSLMAAVVPHFLYDFMTRQLFSNSEIAIFQFTEAPSDLYSAVLHFSFLLIQLALAALLFRKKA